MKYVPSWFPGAGFKTKAYEWSIIMQEMVNKPYQFVKEQLVGFALHESVLFQWTIMPFRLLELPRNLSHQLAWMEEPLPMSMSL